jgi:adenine-specific DNA-methyltransferase
MRMASNALTTLVGMEVAVTNLEETPKARGAFFTPPEIANYLAAWAVGNDPGARIMDPTCGEAVFLLAAGQRLRDLGRDHRAITEQVIGVDIHEASVAEARKLLAAAGLGADLRATDFFQIPTPDQLGCPLPVVDAVIGNPPFVRYQQHTGKARARSRSAAAAQGVDLSGLASSWAALLVHACAFLRPEGRLAMVLPGELLTVGYAAPVRKWLKSRFAEVHLVMFDELQFEHALEKVVLVVAQGSGGCDALSVYHVREGGDLQGLGPFNHLDVVPSPDAKWSDFLLSRPARQLLAEIREAHFVDLSAIGSVELGTVTGANDFFAIDEPTRCENSLCEAQLLRLCPPSRLISTFSLSGAQWSEFREAGQRIWLFHPSQDGDLGASVKEYIRKGEKAEIHRRYKCRVRDPWWRPPAISAPDLFLTYMSHRFPRLIENAAEATCLNTFHGVRLVGQLDRPVIRRSLPFATINTVTMLGAELEGRSYGGGILKLEPREAARLPLPPLNVLLNWSERLQPHMRSLERLAKVGAWDQVQDRVDRLLLIDELKIDAANVDVLRAALASLRRVRLKSPNASR